MLGPAGRAETGRVLQIFHADRDPSERADVLPRCKSLIDRIGLTLRRLGIDRDEGVELDVSGLDPIEGRVGQRTGRAFPATNGSSERFDGGRSEIRDISHARTLRNSRRCCATSDRTLRPRTRRYRRGDAAGRVPHL